MSEIVQVEKEDEHSIKPYKFFYEYGDCADSPAVKGVSKENYKDHFAFRVANRVKVKHAP